MATSQYKTYRTYVNPPNDGRDFRSFYDEINKLTEETRKEIPHTLDLAYGDDPKQKLDIYHPENPENAPVALYFHGGGFFEGDRTDYGYLAAPWVKRGVIVVLASYRLCSDGFTKLDAVADAKSALKWVYENIKTYGGDPNRIVMSGNSAGAIMTANVINDMSWMSDEGIPSSAVKGAVLISGIYNFPLDYNDRPDTLPTPEIKIAMSAIQHIKKVPPKIVVVAGSLETGRDNYVESSIAFTEELKKLTDADVQFHVVPDKDHLQAHHIFNDESLPSFRAMESMFE